MQQEHEGGVQTIQSCIPVGRRLAGLLVAEGEQALKGRASQRGPGMHHNEIAFLSVLLSQAGQALKDLGYAGA